MFSDDEFGESLVQDKLNDGARADSDKENNNKEARPAGPALGVEDEAVVTRRRVFAKLDSEKLLSEDGIPKLKQKIISRISFKGKGYEKRDLSKILGEYQLWAHRLYPKANFDDFITLCRQAGKNTGLKFKRREWIEEEKRGPLYGMDIDNLEADDDKVESWMANSPPPDAIDPLPAITPPRKESSKWSDDESELFVTPKKSTKNTAQHEDNFEGSLFAPRTASSSQITARSRRVIADDDDEPDDNELEEIMANDFSRSSETKKDNKDDLDDIPGDDELAELMNGGNGKADDFADEEAAMAAELGL